MKKLPQLIFETANFHGGDKAELEKAIVAFGSVDYPDLAIKFHAFKADRVALPDFSWYPAVSRFFIEEAAWAALISSAREHGLNVWLDLFCTYGVSVLAQNLDKIQGIKLQPSTQDNREIMEALAGVNVTGKKLIMNAAGLELSEIESRLARFRAFGFSEIILQAGFQDYPTDIADSSLQKLEVLRAAFPRTGLSYADHLDAGDGLAVRFPVYAWLSGCDIIEKHICNDRKNTQYDFNSALEKPQAEELARELQQVERCFGGAFISVNETKYFNKTIQKPVACKPLRAGQLAAVSDLYFRRTDRPGLNMREMEDLQRRFYILNKPLEVNATLTARDYKKTRIAAIVAARLKSSRLKEKAILPIRGMSSIERCLDNCLRFANIDEVILATSTTAEDAALENYTLGGRAKFWRGDPEDVISRYLGACEKYNIDVIIRVTGDCPVISPEIADFLLKAHFEAGADFTEPRRFAVGANSQIYNVEALKRVIELTGRAEYSEHMTLYMTNNPDIFKVHVVDLPQELVRDYRLTLDYQEDLDMFNALFDGLAEQNLEPTLLNVFKILDANPSVPLMNAHKTLVYKTDENLIRLLREKTRIVDGGRNSNG